MELAVGDVAAVVGPASVGLGVGGENVWALQMLLISVLVASTCTLPNGGYGVLKRDR